MHGGEAHELSELSSAMEDYRSASTTYLTGSKILDGPGAAQHMNMKMHMRDASGVNHELNCLLDTGAAVNCISGSQATILEPSTYGLIRRANPPLEFEAADGKMVEAYLTFKGTWYFVGRETEYTHHFYVIEGLPTDVVISCPTILQYGFLMQNPDLLTLGLPNASKTPGLNILSLKEPNKG